MPARRVPSQQRSRASVAAILEATAMLLARGEPLTTNAVSRAAGVAVGTLYQYFPDKAALEAAVHRAAEDGVARALLVATREAADPEAAASALTGALLGAREAHGPLLRNLSATPPPPPDPVHGASATLLGRLHGLPPWAADAAAWPVAAIARAALTSSAPPAAHAVERALAALLAAPVALAPDPRRQGD